MKSDLGHDLGCWQFISADVEAHQLDMHLGQAFREDAQSTLVIPLLKNTQNKDKKPALGIDKLAKKFEESTKKHLLAIGQY